MNAPVEIIIAGFAALPIVELRGAIPLAITVYGFSWPQALLWSLIGNLAAALGLLLLLRRLLEWSSHRWYRLNRLLAWATDRAHRHHSDRVERLEGAALFLLVALPLPLTGAWTGALVATATGFSFGRAVWPIVLGVVVAGIVVTALTTGAVTLFSLIDVVSIVV